MKLLLGSFRRREVLPPEPTLKGLRAPPPLLMLPTLGEQTGDSGEAAGAMAGNPV